MDSNRLMLAGLAALCVTAAGAGGYLAVRQNATPSEPVLAAVPVTNPLALDPTAPIEAAPASANRPESTNTRKPAPSPARATVRPQVAVPEDLPPPREARPAAAPSVAPSVIVPMPVPEAAPVEAAAPIRQEEARPVEPPAVPEPPARRLDEVVVSADSVLGLKLETNVSSDRAKIEDRVDARVDRDVRVGGRVVIPIGARVVGSVTLVERGGRVKERARLGIRFHTLYLADGTQIPISTETLYRNGDERGNSSAAKIGGGAAAGAILGAIIGGAKGAAIGGSVGAGAGTAAVLTSEPSIASFRAGTEITTRILSPIPITVER